ncbi:MAG: GNAT family N-acetyltransferase [Lachnospiraceae bacterium]|nr:GNAT family N-acetyltransferase [Lachnospiraceae bacterium]
MESKVEWLTEEEGTITFSENKTRWLTVQFFVTGEEEAEFRIQDVVFSGVWEENGNSRQEIIQKMTNCLNEAFERLWEEGFEEVVLVEQKGTKWAELLDSTKVVQKVYSEYMMCRRFDAKKTTGSGENRLQITEEQEGWFCENREKTFVCRLLPYRAGTLEEQSFYLYEVEVNRKQRNKGIATACLTELFLQLAKDTAVTVYLQVGSYNEPALHLYQKLGFTISEELCYYALKE